MRILAIGNQALMDGFALLGIETHIDPDKDQLEAILADISASGDRTLIYLQQDLQQLQLPRLENLRREGGSVLISEIPSLHEPHNRQSSLEELIKRFIGPSALEHSHE